MRSMRRISTRIPWIDPNAIPFAVIAPAMGLPCCFAFAASASRAAAISAFISAARISMNPAPASAMGLRASALDCRSPSPCR